MNFLPIFTKYFFKNTILLLFLCIPSSFSDDKYKNEPIYGCDGDLLVDNSTASGPRRQNWIEINHDLDKIKIPESFDARIQWSYCESIQTILYQGRCGGCWAFASGSVMSDRLCIASDGYFNQLLSIQDILECCRQCVNILTGMGGCKGGFPQASFVFWKTKGVVTGGDYGCKPLSEGIYDGIANKLCRRKCTNPYYLRSYKDDKTFAIHTLRKKESKKIDLRHIQAEIMLNGPVVAVMNSYKYLSQFREPTVLKYEESKVDGPPIGHAIKLIGWDEIDGVPVWIMANSWGRNWCDEGFCYIRRGQNDFGIEVDKLILAATPKFYDDIDYDAVRGAGRRGSTSGSFRITINGYFFKSFYFIVFIVYLLVSSIK